jgi:DNA-directed RNA polymerase subunit RPC12/RpoP
MLNKKRALLIALAAMLPLVAVLAGSQYDLVCKNKDCNYKGSIGLGGGFQFEQVTGFCLHCKDFVSLSWNREKKRPQPLKVWNPTKGQVMLLYKCPECQNPFLPVEKIEDLKYCPKCNKATLEHNLTILYD